MKFVVLSSENPIEFLELWNNGKDLRKVPKNVWLFIWPFYFILLILKYVIMNKLAKFPQSM